MNHKFKKRMEKITLEELVANWSYVLHDYEQFQLPRTEHVVQQLYLLRYNQNKNSIASM